MFAVKLRYLMFLMTAPLLGLAFYLVWQDMSRLQSTIEEAERSVIAMQEMRGVADLVHELQKERGYSAGFTASQGANFRAELTAQRRETDAIWAEIRTGLDFSASQMPALVSDTQQKMAELAAWRQRISALDTTVPALAGYYTGMISGLIDMRGVASAGISEATLAPSARAADLISKAKEAAGLERAMGATGLGQPTFPHEIFNRFIALGSEQSVTLSLARDELADATRLQALSDLPSANRVAEMRSNVTTAMQADRTSDLAAGDWFAASTAWIDDLRGVEAQLTQEIAEKAEAILSAARKSLRNEIILISLLAVAVLAITTITFEYLIFRVKRLTKAMERFTQGEFDVWIPGIKNRDEVGAMSAAVYAFKQETLALRKAAEEKKADDEAIILGKAQKVMDLVTDGLSALANADLSRHFDRPLDPEYDSIRADFNTATQRLRDVMVSIAQTAHELDQSAGHLMQSASDLGARTTEQVDTIASTNDRVSKLSDEVADYATHVRNASDQAASAKVRADQSGNVVRSAVDAMGRIASSSQEIGRIITIIEDITFQTNLLALNAGVEAARAGESGRGFAVVASEVRELAKRSSGATQEIKTLIEDSGRNVREGVDLVGEAGDALEKIFAQIEEVDSVLGQVAAGSAGQAEDLRDIAHEVTRLRDLANRNMDAVDASGATARETASISKRMTHLIEDFDLQTGQASPAPPAQVA